ncbi:PREDICTED: F-box protein At5g25290-like [Camelina sativa]|uniref:F-box protein At5g25290-like n=1 Tax=Camelina sativa TaxID=90675 RepID=A0ABM0VSL0_CAMSA|nr:PREDICTED: F-box protein At5g25290-like [Camelina sativa]
MDRPTPKRRLSSPDRESAKALRSSLILQPKGGSPLLMLSQEKADGCRVYNPADDTVYETKSDLSGYRFVASSGKWFLVIDSRLKLYIIDVFGEEERIDLPGLETFEGSHFKIERVGEDKIRHVSFRTLSRTRPSTAEDVRGRLWVEDKKGGDYVVLWHFERSEYIAFCKKGDDHYREISTRDDVRLELRGVKDMLLKGHDLYIFATRDFVRHLDLSRRHDGFKDVSQNHRFPMWEPPLSRDEMERINKYKMTSSNESIAVTRSGEVLVVYTYELTSKDRVFHLYKRDPKDLDPTTYDTMLVEVHSLGDEALFLDLGITVPADHTLGIEPNSIYFTRGNRIRHGQTSSLDICVFSLTTKTIKRFPSLSNLNIKDAQWFLPSS